MSVDNLKNKESSRVVVTDAAVITGLGNNLEALWQGLMAGETAIRPTTRFPVDQDHYFVITEQHPTGLAGLQTAGDHISRGDIEKILGGDCDVGCPQIFGEPGKVPPGAFFFMLEKSPAREISSYGKLGLDSKDRVIFNGSEIKDLTTLVQKCLAGSRHA